MFEKVDVRDKRTLFNFDNCEILFLYLIFQNNLFLVFRGDFKTATYKQTKVKALTLNRLC